MAYQTTLQNITNPTPYDVGISCNEGPSIYLVATVTGKGLAGMYFLPTLRIYVEKVTPYLSVYYEGYES